VLTAPVKAGRPFGRVLNAGFSVMTGALTKLLGGQVLRDAQTFIAAFDTMFGGFRERADATYKLLQAPGTSFLVIATPEPDALREASYFVERLDEERMPLAGLILNRVHSAGLIRLSAARSLAAAETLEAIPNDGVAPASSASYPVTAAALRLHAARMNLGERERRVAGSFMSTHRPFPSSRYLPCQMMCTTSPGCAASVRHSLEPRHPDDADPQVSLTAGRMKQVPWRWDRWFWPTPLPARHAACRLGVSP